MSSIFKQDKGLNKKTCLIVFKTLEIRQQTVLSETQETNEVAIIALA